MWFLVDVTSNNESQKRAEHVNPCWGPSTLLVRILPFLSRPPLAYPPRPLGLFFVPPPVLFAPMPSIRTSTWLDARPPTQADAQPIGEDTRAENKTDDTYVAYLFSNKN